MFKLLVSLFCLVTNLSASSVLFPEGEVGAKEANLCFKQTKLRAPISPISQNIFNIDTKKIHEYAKESAELRLSSIRCIQSKQEKKLEKKVWETLVHLTNLQEEKLFVYEWRILLSDKRPYPFTPDEIERAKEWQKNRLEIRKEIQKLTLDTFLSEPDPKADERFLELFTGYYGSLLREREKFLFSISIESQKAYIEFLKKRTEKE
ncbi:hypothetical protein P3G55_19080 [Leptospira sp. 96542]|nr:hypothetical protein [Leptospira sp. 96542]